MSRNVFAEHAPRFFAANLPVMPLLPQSKKAFIGGWERFHNVMPDKATQESWIANYPNSNIGLVLGEQSGLVMLDIDTSDENLITLITDLLPETPWYKIGKKGKTLAFRYNGTPTFRIKAETGETIVEHLSSRTQTVMPPSIHPDTGMPYRSNCDLIDVLDKIPELDKDIEALLRGALLKAGVKLSTSGWTKLTEYVSVGSRDVTVTKVAGLYAHAVLRGDCTLLEACDHLRAYIDAQVAKVAGDDIDPEKHVKNMITFLKRDVVEKKKVLPQGWDKGLTDEQKEALGLNFSGDQVEMTFAELKQYLIDAFTNHPVDGQGRIEAVEYVLGKLATSKNISSLEEDMLLQYMKQTSGLRVQVGALRKRIKDIQKAEIEGLDHAEIARALVDDLQKITPLRQHADRTWFWAGSHWEPMDYGDVLAKIATDYGHLPAARRYSDHRGIMAIMQNYLEKGIQASDTDGINFANGFLTKKLELLKHAEEFGMTYTLPYRYMPELAENPKRSAPRWFEFLERCWGKDADFEQKVQTLQECICMTMFGIGTVVQRAVLLHGPGRTGKSTMLDIVQSLVPDEARAFVPPHKWDDKFQPVKLVDKIMNICGELPESSMIPGDIFKQVIDGSEMPGQYKGRQIFTFKPKATHWFASNHTPKTRDTSSGFNRRWVILTFRHPIQDHERKLKFADGIIAEEREAIAAWAVQAIPRIMEKNDISLPPSHEELLYHIANVNNSVRFFVEDSGMVVIHPSSSGSKTSLSTSEEEVYRAYWSFTISAASARPVKLTAFRGLMHDLGSEKGFKLVPIETKTGGKAYVYDCLTLVKKGAGNG